jgi:arabinose-5-phosphate isomerase
MGIDFSINMEAANMLNTNSKKNIFAIVSQVVNDEISGINNLLTNLDDNFYSLLQAIIACNGKVILTGMGKSGHIGKKIAATLASTGTPAFFVHPAEALHGDLGMIEANDLVIAISYSGEADELAHIIPILKRKKIKIAGITGNPVNSSLAKLADFVISIKVDKEACPLNLAPTTSTTATLVFGDMLAISLMHLRGFNPQDFDLSHPGGLLGRKLLTYNKDIMHSGKHIPIVSSTSSLKEVVLEISQKGLGFTVVAAEDNNVIGVITDGDLRRRIIDDEVHFSQIKAVDIMTKAPKMVRADELAVKSIDLMEKHKITGFIVVDQQQKLVGAFNLHDLLTAKLL